jgi:hypothetical protein
MHWLLLPSARIPAAAAAAAACCPQLARKVAAASAAAGEGLQPSADAEAGRIMRDILQMEV